MHAIGDWLASLLGTASVPAIAAAIVWKYRERIVAWLERKLAERMDKLVMETELGRLVKSIDEKLNRRR